MNISIYIPVGVEWHPVSEQPPTDALCIVETKSGTRYFQSPVQGRFLADVAYWLQIPERRCE